MHKVSVESSKLSDNGQWVSPSEAILCRGPGNVWDTLLSESQLRARHVIILADHNSRLPPARLHHFARMNCREARIISRSIHEDRTCGDAILDQHIPHDVRLLESFGATTTTDEDCFDCALSIQVERFLQAALKAR